VYRSPLVGEIDEKTCPRNLHPYASSHLAGENAVLYGSITQDDFTGIVLRLSNAIGMPVHKDVNCWMLVSNDLCRQAVTNRKIILNSSGQQKRDFVPMSYVSKVVINIINTDESKIYNVGSGFSLSIIAIAKLIINRYSKLFGYNVELVFSDNQRDFMSQDLIYGSIFDEKLKNDLMSDIELEIDNILKLCAELYE
jgi:UDP-glucose 4-epimerase